MILLLVLLYYITIIIIIIISIVIPDMTRAIARASSPRSGAGKTTHRETGTWTNGDLVSLSGQQCYSELHKEGHWTTGPRLLS